MNTPSDTVFCFLSFLSLALPPEKCFRQPWYVHMCCWGICLVVSIRIMSKKLMALAVGLSAAYSEGLYVAKKLISSEM